MATPPRSLAHAPASANGGDLARLLETEARLEESLGEARTEAARLVAEAQAAARAREAALDAELDAEGRRLEGEIGAQRDRAQRDIAAAAQREAERYDAVPPARIGELARRVVQRLLEGGS